MSRRVCQVPIREVNGYTWGDLSALGIAHEIVGEKVKRVDDEYSFIGGHRVRLYKFTKKVHFKIPDGIQLDISQAEPPRRPQGQYR